jgi:hypothetical protein
MPKSFKFFFTLNTQHECDFVFYAFLPFRTLFVSQVAHFAARFMTKSLKGKFYACKRVKSFRMISHVVTELTASVSERGAIATSLCIHAIFSMLILFFYPEDGSSGLL